MMKFSVQLLGGLCAFIPLAAMAQVATLEPVVVTAPRLDPKSSDAPLGGLTLDEADFPALRATSSDSARLLQKVPGVSLYGAGAISSLPAIHGMADDRVRVQLDGMDLMPACPNHMNPVLSYVDPAKVVSITAFAGMTPVSVGGDSIGGTIQVKSAPPEFARTGEKILTRGQAGTFFRSNGNAYGYDAGVAVATSWAKLSYGESRSQSDNYTAGGGFKPVAQGREGGSPIPADVIASSAHDGSIHRNMGLALQYDEHVLQLDLGLHEVDFEGFPNQRMDMTDNDNTLINIRYTGQYGWGDLEGRFYHQDTRHEMNMGRDRYSYGTGMPMKSKAKTSGAAAYGNIFFSSRDNVRVGAEYMHHTLYDWWPPTGGSMGPNTFWNIDEGRRHKIDAFGEWEAAWNSEWTSSVGLRGSAVETNAAPVQGYDNGLAGSWGDDAAAFNALDRRRTDYNFDVTTLARYVPSAEQTYEAGYARKSHSPNLYQRYAWSTNPMAALMNNFAGDGNGYIGDVDLKPEVANTISVAGDWHDASREQWGVKATGYYTYVQGYIDAQRCDFGQCSSANVTATRGFVFLQYVNQTAQLYGLDLSGRARLGRPTAFGSFTATGLLNYVRGDNRTTGDNLYNMMPLNVTLAVAHRLGTWSNTAEAQLVASKDRVSRVRNEIETDFYPLFSLRSSYVWNFVRFDVGIENLLDRLYAMPLGGAYLGQGPSMTTNGIPWGVAVPGQGRSIHMALTLTY